MPTKEAFEAWADRLIALVTSNIYVSIVALIALHLLVSSLLKSELQGETPTGQSASAPLNISEIYVYPIKSLRGTRVAEALATKNGLAYDRTFMLLQATDAGLKNMAVSSYPEMTQFLTSMDLTQNTVTITFAPQNTTPKSITMPLQPDTSKLDPLDINMHNSPTAAFRMPASYSDWFTACFGYPVVLAYLGPNHRDVLFEDLKPKKSLLGVTGEEHKITFADCAPYLLVSSTSLHSVSSLLPAEQPMDITKFRPNIVLAGAVTPWEEDYWGCVSINGVNIELAHNCVRCKSINIDYATGKPGTGESGQVLKKLQKDRRIDKGAKWSPVFGRYGYSGRGAKWAKGGVMFKEGDEVRVTRVNRERTVWSWPNLS